MAQSCSHRLRITCSYICCASHARTRSLHPAAGVAPCIYATWRAPASGQRYCLPSLPLLLPRRGEPLGLAGLLGCLVCTAGTLLVVHPPFLFGGHQDWGRQRQLGIAAGVLASAAAAGAG